MLGLQALPAAFRDSIYCSWVLLGMNSVLRTFLLKSATRVTNASLTGTCIFPGTARLCQTS